MPPTWMDSFTLLISGIALCVSIAAFAIPLWRMRTHLDATDARFVSIAGCAVLDLILTNRSSEPVAITSVTLNIANESFSAKRLAATLAEQDKHLNGKIIARAAVKSTGLPLTMSPFESERIILRFPAPSEEVALQLRHQGSEGYPTADDEAVPARLLIETSKKTCTLRCPVRVAYPSAWSSQAMDAL